MIGDRLTAFIRTAAPVIVGWALSLPIAGPVLHALGIDTATADRWLTAAVTGALGLAYYVLVRWLEDRWPQLGVLLGVPAKPSYGTASPAVSSLLDVPDTPDPLADVPDRNTPGSSTPTTEGA